MTNKIYNKTNFHRHTFCVFKEVDILTVKNLNPNYISKSGSVYYFVEEGVYRQSNHWGRAANCKWKLESTNKNTKARTKIGFAAWTDFYNDNDFEKLYFINVDFDNKSVTYCHKNMGLINKNAMLRTASETTKTIKIIRDLFENDSWAKHFRTMNINELRKIIINQLIETNLSFQQIKRQLMESL